MPAATLDRRNPTETKSAPNEAFFFAASAVQFEAAGEQKENSKPVSILARTGAPVDHWYWGRIVHDFAGMRAKPVLAYDWCHDADDLVGKGDTHVEGGNLMSTGSIESLEVGDSADKIIKLSGRGVPYEASIYFDPWDMVLEYLPEGMTTEVNDQQVAGPLVIAREWTLRRIAICPSGADSGTEAKFSARAESTASAFSLTWKGQAMSKTDATPTPTADAGKQTPAPAAAATPAPEAAGQQTADPTQKPIQQKASEGTVAKSEFELKLDKFADRFGAEDGLGYLRGGLSYEQALEKHLEKTKLSAEESQQKLAAFNLGETTAVDTGKGGSEGNSGPGDFTANFVAARGKKLS